MNKKGEKEFALAFQHLASLMNCRSEFIPDVIPLKRYGKIIAHRRPFDAVLYTPDKVYSIEFKYQYGKLKDHQRQTGKAINDIILSYYVIRKKVNSKLHTIYTIENVNGDNLFQTNDLQNIIVAFRENYED